MNTGVVRAFATTVLREEYLVRNIVTFASEFLKEADRIDFLTVIEVCRDLNGPVRENDLVVGSMSPQLCRILTLAFRRHREVRANPHRINQDLEHEAEMAQTLFDIFLRLEHPAVAENAYSTIRDGGVVVILPLQEQETPGAFRWTNMPSASM